AERIYARAAGRARAVDTLARTVLVGSSGLHQEFDTALRSGSQPLEAQLARLRISNLLEPTSYCRCDQCSSIFSPAAYFADQLYLLENITPPPHDAASLLKGRRPDLWKLKLSCNNTNITFPEIDAAI